jgi:MobA/MobL family
MGVSFYHLSFRSG